MSTFETIHILTPSPPQKKSTHQHFFSAKIRHENNKNHTKKLKVYRKNVDFHSPPNPQKVYGLYTHENVDIYRWPLNHFPCLTICNTLRKHLS